jgi:membrane protein
MLASLLVSAALTAFGDYLHRIVTGLQTILQVVNLLASFATVTILFALIFKILPDARIAWRDVWLGAIVTAFLFTVAKSLLSLYIGNSDLISGYGASAALVVILVWVYYSSQIMLFGAEITRAYAQRRR